ALRLQRRERHEEGHQRGDRDRCHEPEPGDLAFLASRRAPPQCEFATAAATAAKIAAPNASTTAAMHTQHSTMGSSTARAALPCVVRCATARPTTSSTTAQMAAATPPHSGTTWRTWTVLA